MIYLKSENLLFLKPRKVGGTSFEIALSKFAGEADIITPITEDDEKIRRDLGFRGPQNHLAPSGRRLGRMLKMRKRNEGEEGNWFFNHIPAKRARMRLGAAVFDKAFRVSIVRNPFDRIVSLYYWGARNSETKPDLGDWLRNRPSMINGNDEIYRIDGADVIDFYIRYEHLAEDIARLEEMRPGLRGLGEQFAALNAKGGVRPKDATAAEMFASQPGLVDAVRFFNAPHMAKFGYEAP